VFLFTTKRPAPRHTTKLSSSRLGSPHISSLEHSGGTLKKDSSVGEELLTRQTCCKSFIRLKAARVSSLPPCRQRQRKTGMTTERKRDLRVGTVRAKPLAIRNHHHPRSDALEMVHQGTVVTAQQIPTSVTNFTLFSVRIEFMISCTPSPSL
jgi:hypothetical protein